MNLSKGHREVTICFHGPYVKQTKGGKWKVRRGGSEGEREMTGGCEWCEWEDGREGHRIEGERKSERETEKERLTDLEGRRNDGGGEGRRAKRERGRQRVTSRLYR